MARRKGPSLTRKDVVKAAVECVNAEGENALGVNRVAAQLGIKPPSIYNHVKGNDDLRRLVAIEAWRLLGVACSVPEVQDPKQALTSMADAYRAFAQTHRGLYAIVSTTPLEPDDPDYKDILQTNYKLFSKPFAALGVPADKEVHTVRFLRAAVHGFVILENNGHMKLESEINESFERMVQALVHGIYAIDQESQIPQ